MAKEEQEDSGAATVKRLKTALATAGTVFSVLAGTGGVAYGVTRGEANAATPPHPVSLAPLTVSPLEFGVLKQQVATLEKDRDADRAALREDMKGLNTKLDNIASRLPPVKR